MNKRDEINKRSIIIGITSVAIIAIAIITVIGIFTIKSHAQEKRNEQVKAALSLLKKSEGKTQKQEYKLTKNTVNEKYEKASVVKAEKNDLAKAVFKHAKNEAVKDQGNVASKVEVAKVKKDHKVGSPQSVTKASKLALDKTTLKETKEVV
jgi:FtsZ-interacting cell division protein ZipA